ncbi:phosphopentomutase [Thalassotalea sp. LPB0316]|uniref:phosphopentomutase n=1 Tax=Thalassotalea sp. LPB0316 TaxID=2769490 RepID=UPI0018687ED1|nr:phosphopentomutase [Thalassotalea sp. LPB0316]QOL24915.1 phosphopentomutase [Thalassotalea sp. LPB0316]
MTRAIVMVIDGFGIGHAPDADKFGDIGANTFANLSKHFHQSQSRNLVLPTLSQMGLVEACKAASGAEIHVEPIPATKGAFGYCAEISTGKDTPSGHWEMAGVPVLFDWGYFTDKQHSFPNDLQQQIFQATGIQGMLGNCHASGTTIIAQLGEEHIKSGLPICYTSADSVFQVAAHEEHFGLENLYKYCETVQAIVGPMNIGRVIARPFIGNDASDFERTGNRRDFSILPPEPTILDKLKAAGGEVISVGKIADIFAQQGITQKTKATGIEALVDATMAHMATAPSNSIIFTNLVNFDQDFGHRRDPVGFGLALEAFDSQLAKLLCQLNDDDTLFLIADHGCDPTWQGSNHTREYVPLLAFHNQINSVSLGERSTFADLGQTLAEMFKLEKMRYGTSFYSNL